jgi:hypothetical protein
LTERGQTTSAWVAWLEQRPGHGAWMTGNASISGV